MGGKAHAVELGPNTVCFSEQMCFGRGFCAPGATEAPSRSEEMRKGGFYSVITDGARAGPANRKSHP